MEAEPLTAPEVLAVVETQRCLRRLVHLTCGFFSSSSGSCAADLESGSTRPDIERVGINSTTEVLLFDLRTARGTRTCRSTVVVRGSGTDRRGASGAVWHVLGGRPALGIDDVGEAEGPGSTRLVQEAGPF